MGLALVPLCSRIGRGRGARFSWRWLSETSSQIVGVESDFGAAGWYLNCSEIWDLKSQISESTIRTRDSCRRPAGHRATPAPATLRFRRGKCELFSRWRSCGFFTAGVSSVSFPGRPPSRHQTLSDRPFPHRTSDLLAPACLVVESDGRLPYQALSAARSGAVGSLFDVPASGVALMTGGRSGLRRFNRMLIDDLAPPYSAAAVRRTPFANSPSTSLIFSFEVRMTNCVFSCSLRSRHRVDGHVGKDLPRRRASQAPCGPPRRPSRLSD